MKLNIDNYPALRDYLLTFGKRLHQTGGTGCRKKTGNKWFETQDQISYHKHFNDVKIIYPNMTKYLPFIYDEEKYVTNQKCFIITGDNLKYLTVILNSNVAKYWIQNNCPELQGGTRELSSIFFAYIPLPYINKIEQQPFVDIANQILEIKQNNPQADTSALEAKIDQMVYTLYNLSDYEIRIIEQI